jgi:hypothetical protein
MNACFKDKSNLNIVNPNIVAIRNIDSLYNLVAYKDTLKIDPVLSSANDNLEYSWKYYNEKEAQADMSKLKTIGNTKNLSFPVDIEIGNYTMVYCVRDIETNISVYAKTKLIVNTVTSQGWMVLKDKNGYSDMDIFNDDIKLFNIISKVNNGRKLTGKGLRIGFTSKYNYLDPNDWTIEENIRCLFLMTESDVSLLRISNMHELHNYNTMFFAAPQECKPNFWISTFNGLFLGNNGKAYFLNKRIKTSGKFGSEHLSDHDYSLSDYFAVGYARDITVYDKTESSFYILTGKNNNMQLIPYEDTYSPFVHVAETYPNKHLNADIVYMGSQKGGIGKYKKAGIGIALLKTRSEPTQLMLYHLNLISNMMVVGASFSFKKNPVFKVDTLALNLNINNAEQYALNKDFNLLYFSIDNKVYYYNMDSQTEEVIYTLSEGEKINYIHHMQHNRGNTFDKLVFASHVNDKYKIYIFDMLAGRPTGEPTILEGEGRVADVINIASDLEYYNY